MTMYTPDLHERSGPKYRRIADAIADDIHENRLTKGIKLPTHRDLAYRLGVTVGTITRAYAELQRLGLAGGQVGSGTYVQDSTEKKPLFSMPKDITAREGLCQKNFTTAQKQSATGIIDLSMNRPPPGPETEALSATLGEISQSSDLAPLTQYTPSPGMPFHRTAVASLLSTLGLDCTGDDMILTNGAQHAMIASTLCLLKAGDVLLTENLTYPGMTSITSHINVRVHPVLMDEYGMRPDALEAAIRETGARVVYLMPVMQNPTTATMNMERLNAIAHIAKRHNLIIIEDDVYGFQPQNRNPPLAQMIPENTIYINGFSKSLSPGLRVGCMKVPKSLFSSLTHAVQISGWMIPPLMGEIAARWIKTGLADHIIQWHQQEAIARNAMAREILQDFQFNAQPECLHIWLDLPKDHPLNDTIKALKDLGVILVGPEFFITRQADSPHAFRLCLGSPPTQELLRVGLKRVRQVLQGKPIPSFSQLDTMVI